MLTHEKKTILEAAYPILQRRDVNHTITTDQVEEYQNFRSTLDLLIEKRRSLIHEHLTIEEQHTVDENARFLERIRGRLLVDMERLIEKETSRIIRAFEQQLKEAAEKNQPSTNYKRGRDGRDKDDPTP